MTKPREGWGTRVGLVLAMAGNAVGLGNFLRFPVQAINNGGGAFIIPYLVSFLVMGIPLLWVEWGMGRLGGSRGHHSPPFMFEALAPRMKFWKYFGVFGIWTNIAMAAYYCYIESWTMSYVMHSLARTFEGMSQSEVAAFFINYIDISTTTTGIPFEAPIFYVLCLLLNTWILSRGLEGGVEKTARIGMPLLIIFGIVLAIRGLTLGTSGASPEHPDANAWAGLSFLWTPQFIPRHGDDSLLRFIRQIPRRRGPQRHERGVDERVRRGGARELDRHPHRGRVPGARMGEAERRFRHGLPDDAVPL